MAAKSDNTEIQKWLRVIANYDNEFKKWTGSVEKILKRYKDDFRTGQSGYSEARFNILWSNIQTIIPAVFSKLPKPDISRRFRDNDPVGRVASLILERALEFEVEHYPDYRAAMTNSVQDRFLGGRGISWVRYEPHIIAKQQELPEDGVQVTEDADEPEEELDYECAPTDYVHWKDFGHNVARTWEEVTCVWRKVYMARTALVERFGEELGNKIPLDTKPDEQKKGNGDGSENYQALVYELWDKESKTALWISKSLNQILDTKTDPYELECFWPCPRPLFATLTSDSLVPVPDFKLYQDQANELNILCDRIDGLIKALQVKGVYDASFTELSRLFTEGENNTLIPVKNWASFAEKQGLKGAIDLVDIQPIAMTLIQAYKAMEQVKAQVYEITGLSDIIRGQSEASETATAQQLKGQYASLRLKSMQDNVAQFATEILRIKAQIMCKMFQPETLLKISAAEQLSEADQQLVPQAIQMLKSEPMRSFRIEIAADSMVQMDETQEKQDRMEFLQAAGGFIKQAAEVGQQSPELIPLLMDMLKFGIAGFKVGKSIEGQFDETAERMKQMASQPKPPQPDPAQIKAQQQAQSDQMNAQAQDQQHQREMQLEQQRLQMEANMRIHEQQTQAAIEQHRNEMEMQREQQSQQHEAVMQQMQAHADEQTKLLLAHLDRITKLEIAEISAQTTLNTSQMSAAQQGANDATV